MIYPYRWPKSRKARVRKVPYWEEDSPVWCAGRPGQTYPDTDGWHFYTFEAALGHAVGYCLNCFRPGHLGKCNADEPPW